MIRIAETLGAETDFVRVDLYDLGDRVVFGELTNTPNAGKNCRRPVVRPVAGRVLGPGAVAPRRSRLERRAERRARPLDERRRALEAVGVG